MKPDPAVSSGLTRDACQQACTLLDHLSADPKVGKFVQNFLVSNSQALIFTWTVKAGLGIGYSGGHGFLLGKIAKNEWSAPCFIKVNVAQAGLILGVEKVETLMGASTDAVADAIMSGKTAVIGSDLSIQIWPIAQRVGAEVTKELKDAWSGSQLNSISYGQGLIFDISFKGGSISVDDDQNAACYGKGTTAMHILEGDVKALYDVDINPLFMKLASLSKQS